MTTNFDAALAFREKGYNVVPQAAIGKKYPAINWKGLQDRRAELGELEGWKHLFENGVGFVTGAISGVIVIESDGPEGEAVLAEFEREHDPLPETLTIRSGSGRGLHRHFRHPGFTVKTVANTSIKLDVKGDKGYCVLPPSLHRSGGRYEVVCDSEPAPLPDGLLDFIEMKAADAKGAWPKSARPALIDESSGNAVRPALPPPPAEAMRAMLKHLAALDCFEERGGVETDTEGRIIKVGWMEAGMALKLAYGDEVGFELWDETHEDATARADASGQWAGYAAEAQSGHVTIGTIIKAAKDAGFSCSIQKCNAPVPTLDRASAHRSYGPFTMDPERGLTKEVKVGRGENATTETLRISAPFEVLGACRDPQGRAWGKQIQFPDADGRLHRRHVPDAALHGDPATLCGELAHEGLWINRQRQRELAEYLSGVAVAERVTNVSRTGWHDLDGERVFVLPAGTIALGEGERVALEGGARGPYEACGSLEEWKQGVGAMTSGHALPVFMVSAALAGPLAHLVGAEGGGVHVYGPSSIGKSAMLAAGASVWGRGNEKGYVRSWRSTANGLEGAAASATDTCLVLDEIGLGNPREVADAIYALANGLGKQRAGRDGSAREPKAWRVFVLSSGEVTIETKLGEDHGRKVRAGQTIRLLDIDADRGLAFGAFDNGGQFADAGKLADAIKAAACSSYGTAGPEFVRRLIADGLDRVAAEAKMMVTGFTEKYAASGSAEQVGRAAHKFALIGIAGELATALGVTPWEKGEAQRATGWAFERWLEARGGVGSHEERQAVEQVRLMIVQHGEARFECAAGGGGTAAVRDRLGWRKGEGGQREWWVPTETWKAEFCAGLDPQRVARALASRGMLRRQGDGRNLTCVVKLFGNQTVRCYVLTAAIIESDVG